MTYSKLLNGELQILRAMTQGLICLFCLSSCISSSVRVETVPEGAEVLVSTGGQVPSKVGMTPTQIDTTLAKFNESPVLVSISKPGFKRESVLVPPSALGQEAKIQLQLTEDAAGPTKASQNIDTMIDEVARSVAKVQDLVRGKEYDQAMTSINSLLLKYPNVSTLYGLQGNIFYIQKNIDKALSAYRKAESLAPNGDTQKIINKLESIKGGGAP